MKKTLLIALLLIPCLGFSQTLKPIIGFAGIKFGSSKAIVLAAMKAKGAVLDKENSNATTLMFSNVKLGSREADALQIDFVDNQAFEGIYTFTTDVEAKVPGFYQALVNDYKDVYGDAKITRQFNDPYVEGDGNELLGLSAGKIIYSAIWLDSQNKSSVYIQITSKMEIIVTYQSDDLFKKYADKEKTKNKTDY